MLYVVDEFSVLNDSFCTSSICFLCHFWAESKQFLTVDGELFSKLMGTASWSYQEPPSLEKVKRFHARTTRKIRFLSFFFYFNQSEADI